jgi:DNA-binding NarL/FixJ family response regulator
MTRIDECPQNDTLLSPRECQVVRLIAEGLTNKEIGAFLHLSVKTIETHRGSAMRKLNVTSTAGLVRYAIRSGLVEA